MKSLLLSLTLFASTMLNVTSANSAQSSELVCSSYSAFCVTLSRHSLPFANGYNEILSSVLVKSTTLEGLVEQCPDQTVWRTVLLNSYFPRSIKLGIQTLPGRHLKEGDYVYATERNSCRNKVDAPLKD